MSCYPVINGSGQSSYKLWVPDDDLPKKGSWRETLDPDDFTSGFAIWSGTSFAAPLFAGEVAQFLFENGTERVPQGQAVTRCDAAVDACVKRPVGQS
jgi:subtilisin family serine protease